MSSSERPQIFQASIPGAVDPGDSFHVALPNGEKIAVRCPLDKRPGDVFQVHPYRVTLPEGVKAKKYFTVLVEGNPMNVRAPKKAKPGQSMIIYAPVFNPKGSKSRSSDTKASKQWDEYLSKVGSAAPKVDETMVASMVDLDTDDTPGDYICPITQEIMMDPVVAIDGHSYDRTAIQEWFQSNDTSPKTNEHLPSKILIPNLALRATILHYLQQFAKSSGVPVCANGDTPSSSSSSASTRASTSSQPARASVSVVELTVKPHRRKRLHFDASTPAAVDAMERKSFDLPAGGKYKLGAKLRVVGDSCVGLRIFAITQHAESGNVAINEHEMGDFEPKDGVHEWQVKLRAPEGADALGKYVSDYQFIDGTGKIHLECQHRFTVVAVDGSPAVSGNDDDSDAGGGDDGGSEPLPATETSNGSEPDLSLLEINSDTDNNNTNNNNENNGSTANGNGNGHSGSGKESDGKSQDSDGGGDPKGDESGCIDL